MSFFFSLVKTFSSAFQLQRGLHQRRMHGRKDHNGGGFTPSLPWGWTVRKTRPPPSASTWECACRPSAHVHRFYSHLGISTRLRISTPAKLPQVGLFNIAHSSSRAPRRRGLIQRVTLTELSLHPYRQIRVWGKQFRRGFWDWQCISYQFFRYLWFE